LHKGFFYVLILLLTKEKEMNSQEKKVYYNRVRRTCKLHDIEIVYDGVREMYRAVELIKDGSVMFADRATTRTPLNINWKRLHEELTDYGYVGGVK
tara:strand:+ start:1109 stop:1396 length:288 start_codon:yes stop_codon:yes gene_type:complete